MVCVRREKPAWSQSSLEARQGMEISVTSGVSAACIFLFLTLVCMPVQAIRPSRASGPFYFRSSACPDGVYLTTPPPKNDHISNALFTTATSKNDANAQCIAAGLQFLYTDALHRCLQTFLDHLNSTEDAISRAIVSVNNNMKIMAAGGNNAVQDPVVGRAYRVVCADVYYQCANSGAHLTLSRPWARDHTPQPLSSACTASGYSVASDSSPCLRTFVRDVGSEIFPDYTSPLGGIYFSLALVTMTPSTASSTIYSSLLCLDQYTDQYNVPSTGTGKNAEYPSCPPRSFLTTPYGLGLDFTTDSLTVAKDVCNKAGYSVPELYTTNNCLQQFKSSVRSTTQNVNYPKSGRWMVQAFSSNKGFYTDTNGFNKRSVQGNNSNVVCYGETPRYAVQRIRNPYRRSYHIWLTVHFDTNPFTALDCAALHQDASAKPVDQEDSRQKAALQAIISSGRANGLSLTGLASKGCVTVCGGSANAGVDTVYTDGSYTCLPGFKVFSRAPALCVNRRWVVNCTSCKADISARHTNQGVTKVETNGSYTCKPGFKKLDNGPAACALREATTTCSPLRPTTIVRQFSNNSPYYLFVHVRSDGTIPTFTSQQGAAEYCKTTHSMPPQYKYPLPDPENRDQKAILLGVMANNKLVNDPLRGGLGVWDNNGRLLHLNEGKTAFKITERTGQTGLAFCVARCDQGFGSEGLSNVNSEGEYSCKPYFHKTDRKPAFCASGKWVASCIQCNPSKDKGVLFVADSPAFGTFACKAPYKRTSTQPAYCANGFFKTTCTGPTTCTSDHTFSGLQLRTPIADRSIGAMATMPYLNDPNLLPCKSGMSAMQAQCIVAADGTTHWEPLCGCPVGWTVTVSGDRQTRSCLKFVNEVKTWAAAMKSCKAEGASLVEITTAEENNKVNALVQSHPIWLGMARSGSLDNLAFKNAHEFILQTLQQPLSYKNWLPQQPDNYPFDPLGFQNCAYMTNTGGWDDSGCLATFRYVCERNLGGYCQGKSFPRDAIATSLPLQTFLPQGASIMAVVNTTGFFYTCTFGQWARGQLITNACYGGNLKLSSEDGTLPARWVVNKFYPNGSRVRVDGSPHKLEMKCVNAVWLKGCNVNGLGGVSHTYDPDTWLPMGFSFIGVTRAPVFGFPTRAPFKFVCQDYGTWDRVGNPMRNQYCEGKYAYERGFNVSRKALFAVNTVLDGPCQLPCKRADGIRGYGGHTPEFANWDYTDCKKKNVRKFRE